MSNLSFVLVLVLFIAALGLNMRGKDAMETIAASDRSKTWPKYVLIYRGTCKQAGYIAVKSAAECQKAANDDLRLKDTSASRNNNTVHPSGCYYRRQSSTKKLWYNKNGLNIPASSSRRLICFTDWHWYAARFRNLQGLVSTSNFSPVLKRYNGRPVWKSGEAHLFFAKGHYRVGMNLSNRSDAGIFRSVPKASKANGWLRSPFWKIPMYRGWEIKDKLSRTGWKVSPVITHEFALHAHAYTDWSVGDVITCRHKVTGKQYKDRQIAGKSAFLPDDPSRRRSGQPCAAFKSKHCGVAALTSRRRASGAEALKTCKKTCRLNFQRVSNFGFCGNGLEFRMLGYNYNKANAICQAFDHNCIAELKGAGCF